MKSLLLRGGFLLIISAGISKLLGFLRDQLLVANFSLLQTDAIFVAFRIPDFFFGLLILGVTTTVILPRLHRLKPVEESLFFSAIFWRIFVVMACIFGFIGIFSEFFVSLLAPAMKPALQQQAAILVRYLCASVFLISISAIFFTLWQYRERFWIMAIAPLSYMGGMALALYFFAEKLGFLTVGYGALFGAIIQTVILIVPFFINGEALVFQWKIPRHLWQSIWVDTQRRIATNVAFQTNQTMDVWIAGFLIVGSITAFNIGSLLGNFLFTVIGIPVANAVFSRLTRQKNDPKTQWKTLHHAVGVIFCFAIPAVALGLWVGKPFIQFFYDMTSEGFFMTHISFFWVLLSAPFACVIPLFSRFFYAHHESRIPLWCSVFSLAAGTTTALILALVVWDGAEAVRGIALGTFVANTLNAALFYYFLRRKYGTLHH